MARSTYIYILLSDREIIGAFTVKHEMEAFLKRNPDLPQLTVRRYRDGYPGFMEMEG